MTKIIGVRQVVRDVRECPRGHHVEIWSYKDERGDVRLYTSCWLSQNSWTDPAGHAGEREIFPALAFEDYGHHSLTDRIKTATALAWGLTVNGS